MLEMMSGLQGQPAEFLVHNKTQPTWRANHAYQLLTQWDDPTSMIWIYQINHHHQDHMRDF